VIPEVVGMDTVRGIECDHAFAARRAVAGIPRQDLPGQDLHVRVLRPYLIDERAERGEDRIRGCERRRGNGYSRSWERSQDVP
jgi:hypothetical protein